MAIPMGRDSPVNGSVVVVCVSVVPQDLVPLVVADVDVSVCVDRHAEGVAEVAERHHHLVRVLRRRPHEIRRGGRGYDHHE